jgi:ferritin-like protein
MPASTTLHESAEVIGSDIVDRHRALVSLGEELEAVDWYDQRAAATNDPSLRAVLEHNRDEEKEHAMMTLEWLRRRDPVLDQHMRTYLFTDAPITDIEHEAEHEPGTDARESGDLGLGSLADADA